MSAKRLTNHLRYEKTFGKSSGTGVFVDLNEIKSGCIVVRATSGDDKSQGGLIQAEGGFELCRAFCEDRNQALKGGFHIKLPDGTYFPEDYIVHPNT